MVVGGVSKMCSNIFWYSISPLKIILHSLQVIFNNKLIFTTIFTSLSLPLSLLTLSLSLLSLPLLSQIHHLEAIALLAATRFEARHVWEESRSDALYLLKLKTLISLPIFLLSVAAATSAVSLTVQSRLSKTLTLTSAVTAVKQNWKKSSVTSIVNYCILFAFAPIPRILAVITPLKDEMRFVGLSFEVYLMAVLSLGLVVSISEERFGFDAVKVGFRLMAGRRLCGFVLSAFFAVVSGEIRRRMEDSVFSGEGKMVIVLVYAFVVVWSYVVMGVFYCECKGRHHGIIKEVDYDDDNKDDEETGISNSML